MDIVLYRRGLQTSIYYEVTVPNKVECMNSRGTFDLLLVVSNWPLSFTLRAVSFLSPYGRLISICLLQT